ncbi:Hypothetical protein PHPALM_20304 [Phytophthora palmivora]|uniref:Reverse transcriptase n=1 Tax=Phytophthora palmivora TaxID=4796 RepID=A0A2P4XF73_9STRA|nr:Hypothetical protein PHPALM_20304 [Phytophthora palmivora]
MTANRYAVSLDNIQRLHHELRLRLGNGLWVAVPSLQEKFDAAVQGLCRLKRPAASTLERLASSATPDLPDDDAIMCLNTDASANG